MVMKASMVLTNGTHRFWLNILDRNSIANAKIAGLPAELGMSNNDYNTCLLIFYVVSI
jgi:hypothetical protein